MFAQTTTHFFLHTSHFTKTTLYYPKAGDSKTIKNPKIKLWIYDIYTTKIDLLPDTISFEDGFNPILANFKFLTENRMVGVWLNRFSNEQKTVIYKYQDDFQLTINTIKTVDSVEIGNGWVKHNEIIPVNDETSDFIMLQSFQNFQHIFRISETENAGQKQALTSGAVDVTKIYGVRLSNKPEDLNPAYVAVFQAAPTPGKLHIYSLNLNFGRDASYNPVTTYPVGYTDPEITPEMTDFNGVWYCYTCIDECWQSGSKNCKIRINGVLDSIREKCESYDLSPAPGFSKSQDLVLVSCNGPSVPFQFFTKICERTENFYPWKEFYLLTDNYEVEKTVSEKIVPGVESGEYKVVFQIVVLGAKIQFLN